jgi:hypothetical protein
MNYLETAEAYAMRWLQWSQYRDWYGPDPKSPEPHMPDLSLSPKPNNHVGESNESAVSRRHGATP